MNRPSRFFVHPLPGPVPLVDGILPVDKPAGVTSHDVVDRIRRRFKQKKVGHGGTLDPMATGLLVILMGRGTRLSQRVMGGDKTYEGLMHLGMSTDTQDVDGEVTAERDASGVTAERLRAAMAAWVGDRQQVPPMVSAIKKDGVPLYKLARKGETIEREPRFIHVYSFELLEFQPPMAEFRLTCTKGTYVRTLAHDIGEELGCGAFLERLRRTASGSFRIDQAVSFEQLIEGGIDDLLKNVLPLSVAGPYSHET